MGKTEIVKGRIADMISYQEGSVVSREIIRKKSGTVTIFAFDAGQGLSEHTAPFDALVTILDGEGTVVVGGTPHNLISGEMIIMPAGKPHAISCEVKFKMMLVMIKSE